MNKDVSCLFGNELNDTFNFSHNDMEGERGNRLGDTFRYKHKKMGIKYSGMLLTDIDASFIDFHKRGTNGFLELKKKGGIDRFTPTESVLYAMLIELAPVYFAEGELVEYPNKKANEFRNIDIYKVNSIQVISWENVIWDKTLILENQTYAQFMDWEFDMRLNSKDMFTLNDAMIAGKAVREARERKLKPKQITTPIDPKLIKPIEPPAPIKCSYKIGANLKATQSNFMGEQPPPSPYSQA